MWDSIRAERHLTDQRTRECKPRQGRRSSRQLRPEPLEDRQLMAASLLPIADLTVPALQGYTLPLLGSPTATQPQNFVVASSNPDIAVTVAQGEFWTLGVSYTDPVNPANSFTGSLTFELFQSLTPNTVTQITTLTNQGYFVNTGKYIQRIVAGFPTASDYAVQGGAPTPTGEEDSPPLTFANEDVQQLAFTGTDQLAMANTGQPDSNSSQFFITTGSPNSELGYNYTIFGQLLSGQSTLTKITQIPVMLNPLLREPSEPVNPLTITSATLSSNYSDGVALIDTTQAKPGETSNITVIAYSSSDHTNVTETFKVTVGAYGGPTLTSMIGNVNFRPYANPVTFSGPLDTAQQVQLAGQNTYPDHSATVPLAYGLASDPNHGTISNFNSATGTFTYTPNSGFVGTDTFQYEVEATGPDFTAAAAISNPATVTISVTAPVTTLTQVELVMNKQHQVTQVIAIFSGALNFTEADQPTYYRLATPGKRGSYTAKNAGIIHLKKAVYAAASHSVTLTPSKPFTVKKPVQLLIRGAGPSGLQDSLGRFLDSIASAILSKNGVTIEES